MVDTSIVDRESGRELPVYWSEGQAYVVGNPGRENEIVARNRRREDLLAVVSVDGVNALSGETVSLRAVLLRAAGSSSPGNKGVAPQLGRNSILLLHRAM